MTDLIAGAVVIAIIGGAIGYIVKSKKNGTKCIGCPMSKNCNSECKKNTFE